MSGMSLLAAASALGAMNQPPVRIDPANSRVAGSGSASRLAPKAESAVRSPP